MSSVGIAYIGENTQELDFGSEQREYTRVIVNVSDKVSYVAGSEGGETLEVDCPFGTQEMADNILESVYGYVYKPYEAKNAELDPSAEIGDAVSVNGNYVGLYSMDTEFGSTPVSTVSAPTSEDIDSEFPHESKQERTIARQFESYESSLKATASEINAKVSKTGGNASSFGWTLDSNGFILSSNGSTVMKADKTGIIVYGTVYANVGRIGCTFDSDGKPQGGFTIESNAIYYGSNKLGSSAANGGVYIGTDGISLGKNGEFKVDSSGNLTATNGSFSGTVYAKNVSNSGGTLNSNCIGSGSISSDKIVNKAISSGKLSDAVAADLAKGVEASKITAGTAQATNLKASNATFGTLSVGTGSGLKQYERIQVLGPDGSVRYALGTYK